jgi:plastocyanin
MRLEVGAGPATREIRMSVPSLASGEGLLFLALVSATLAALLEVARGLALGAVAQDQLPLLAGYVVLFLPPAGAGGLILLGNRLALPASLAASTLPLVATYPFAASVLGNPSLPYFASVLVSTVALAAAAALATQLLVERRERAPPVRERSQRDSRSRHLATLFVGIAVGGLAIGVIAGATISSLLSRGPLDAPDVVIVRGAFDHSQHEAYAPPFVMAVAGVNSTLTWYNADVETHTVTAGDGSFDSGPIAPGESWTLEFTEPGSFPYFCRPHPWMKGVVTVET